MALDKNSMIIYRETAASQNRGVPFSFLRYLRLGGAVILEIFPNDR
jgi:hypothetical protein